MANKKTTAKQVVQDKADRILEGVAVWTSFYRANPHRFAREFLNVKLKLFQKILIYAMMINNYFCYIASRGQRIWRIITSPSFLRRNCMKSIFTKEQIEYLKENYDKESYREIGNKFGFTERQIRGKINGMGLSKTRKFNDRYFECIDNGNKAYWLGFIYADGYIIKNEKLSNYELGIELNINDRKTLEDFNEELGDVHYIYEKHNHKSFNGYEYDTDSCVIRIYSKNLVNDLINLNVLPNKTYEKSYPICENYFFDFIRGFLDGDGCIYYQQKNLYVKFTNSNYDFLLYLQEIL